MSGDQKPPNGSQFDRLISQVSDAGVNLSQPMSDDTFSQLWSHIATDGCLNTLMEPSSWTFSEHFEGGEPVENSVDVQLEHFQLSPMQQMGIDYNGLSQNQPYQPNIVLPVDNAAPGHPMPEYPGDISNTPPPTSAASQALPSNVDYTGDFGFEISLGQPTSTAAKSVSWTKKGKGIEPNLENAYKTKRMYLLRNSYSPSLKKLFVDKDKACPVMFKTTVEPPPGSYIRAMPIFKKPEYVQEPVKRCPNHAGPVSDPSSHHLVTCSDPSAQYDVDPTTQRMSVSVTYNSPQVGTEHTTYLYVFKCFLSCVGGLNRRQIQTVFTLEHNGMVLGRQVIDVRVCACPGRDRKGEEKQQTDKSLKKPLKRGQSKVSQSVNITQVGGKRKKPDDEIYTLTVRGKGNYEILLRIKESLELMMYVTQDQRNSYKAEQARIQQQFRKVVKSLSRTKPAEADASRETK